MIPRHTYISDDEIRQAMATWFEISPDDVTSNARHQWRVQLRAALVYVLRGEYGWDWDRLAELIKRDRRTVKHLRQMAEDTIMHGTQSWHHRTYLETSRCLRKLIENN